MDSSRGQYDKMYFNPFSPALDSQIGTTFQQLPPVPESNLGAEVKLLKTSYHWLQLTNMPESVENFFYFNRAMTGKPCLGSSSKWSKPCEVGGAQSLEVDS